MIDVLKKDFYVLIEPDKKSGYEGIGARLSMLTGEQQRKLYTILFLTSKSEHELVTKRFLARILAERMKERGDVVPD